MTMNDRIKYLRKEVLKIRQDEFAEKINLGRATISKIEVGDIALTDRNIKAICEAFSVSENWIRTGKEPMYIELDSDKELASLFAKFAQSTIVKDDPFTKTILIEMMKFMVDAKEEEWEPIKKFIKKLAASLE